MDLIERVHGDIYEEGIVKPLRGKNNQIVPVVNDSPRRQRRSVCPFLLPRRLRTSE